MVWYDGSPGWDSIVEYVNPDLIVSTVIVDVIVFVVVVVVVIRFSGWC